MKKNNNTGSFRFTIKAKISFGIILNMVFILLIGFYSIYTMSRTSAKMEKIAKVDIFLIKAITRIETHQLKQGTSFKKALRAIPKIKTSSQAKSDFHKAQKKFKESAKMVNKEILSIEEAIRDSIKATSTKEEKQKFKYIFEALKKIEKQHFEYEFHISNILNLIEDEKWDANKNALARVEEEEKELNNKIIGLLLQVENYAEKTSLEAEEIEKAGLKGVIVLLSFVFIVGLFVSFLTIHFITKPIYRLLEMAKSVNRGNYNVKVDDMGSDELRDLGVSIKKMAEVLMNVSLAAEEQLQNFSAQNQKQLWQINGLSRINEIVRGELDIRKAAHKLCQFFAKHLNCQIITFYILNNNKLGLAGSYAFNKRKSLGNFVEIGEGFVGQAALEKQVISVVNIPDEYTRINSSIGDLKPRNIVVVPFLCNEQVQGVMEVGSFEEISDEKLEFLKRTMEPIGITINSINDQAKTKILLEKTQIQTRELQDQQAELKVVNENLEEQAQLLRESEEKLKQQSEELRVSNEELTEKQELLKKQKDEVEAAKKDVEIKANELALASKYKSEFLANMSHELRTPLNSLLLLSKGLAANRKGHLDASEVEDAKVIYDGGNDLLELINDILDLSKVEAGMLSITIENVRMDTIARNLHKTFNPVAAERGLIFKTNIESDLPEMIKSDGQRLQQILKNLLSNAMKFTENGSITLDIGKTKSDVAFYHSNLTPDSTISFAVIDTGVGIPPDKQQAIFEAFQQQDGSTSRKYGGTGLGLTISRELARLLGGEIQLKSTLGMGSTFTLHLPKKISTDSIEQEKTAHKEENSGNNYEESRVFHSLNSEKNTTSHSFQFIPDDRKDIDEKDKTLLIVDDDKKFAKILYRHAKGKGYKCLVAGDGRSGILLAKEYKPDGILLDLGLPDIGGHQVLEQLKFSLATRHIPVQIISAYDKDQNKCMLQGALGYLTKPVSEEQLNSALKEIGKMAKTDIRNILVVEDDEKSRRGITSILKNIGVSIKCVDTGKEGCVEIFNNKYDCVILDLGLPDMSGFDVLKNINENRSNGLPPIIIYTGKEITDEEYAELNKYTSTIIVKGTDSDERLLDDVSLFLHTVESNLKNERQEEICMMHNEDAMLKDRKVLLVDDDMRNTYALSKQLIDFGFDVEMAKNGQEAVEILEENHSYELILMDIMMPIMNGYEATRHIRKMHNYKDIPIIALTAKAMPEDRDKCLQAGASEYLIKPIDFEKLLSIMRIWLFK